MAKVVYVSAYSPVNYVRTEVLLSMLEQMGGLHLVRATNSSTGPFRYAQTLFRLIVARLKHNPDVYILGFRGYEVYWPVRFLTIGKPLIFDEFINPYLWFVEEHEKFQEKGIRAYLLKMYARSMLAASQAVLTDTNLSADYSSRKMNIPRSKFTTLYVGTNETLFDEKNRARSKQDARTLSVFFYGNFLPLHGMDVILDTAKRLRDEPVHFIIIGGAKRKRDMENLTQFVRENRLKNLTHKPWVPYEELPEYIARADVCLGGPFGDTPQAQLVITGKTYQFLAMGKCTIIGTVGEDVGFEDRKNCLLTDQGSPEKLEAAIRWALQNREKLPGIGQSGKALYLKAFSQRAQEHKLAKLISELTAQSR